MCKRSFWIVFTVLAVIVIGVYAAQQWNGVVRTDTSSIGATRVVSQSKVIPAPQPPFGGIIKRNAYDSTAWWPPVNAPKKSAPNVLLVLIDDEGFGAPSTFGGLIPMPTSDQLAKEGLRNTNFHTTALCSPIRAALITGRTMALWGSSKSPNSQPGSLATTG